MKNSGIAVVCSIEADGSFKNVTFELLGAARSLAEKTGEKVIALVCADENCDVSVLGDFGAEKVFVLSHRKSEIFELEGDVSAVSSIISEVLPSIVLFPATDYGRVLAPEVAARLHCGITADCTDFDIDAEGRLVQIRPALGGNIMAHIISPSTLPQMATARPSVFKKREYKTENFEKNIVRNDFAELAKRVLKLKENSIITGNSAKIEDASVVVSVGSGISSQELLKHFGDFAVSIGGVLACSRKIVEKGWLEQPRQVGQSGKTITPEIYFAIGISGAVQHLAGMKSSGFIVAVNIDKSAEIFNYSDLGFVMDAEEWLREAEKFFTRRPE
ncbi:electron transfer flavoprotein subunit alpha/FixB family protein [bacterium]|nr:electron transfer flavoprotein subunit alpha/FixB family protein [bacterium]